MLKLMSCRLIPTILSVVLLTVMGKGQDLYSDKATQKFADYLFTKGDFKYAAEEYTRLLFMNPDSDSVLVRLSQSYRRIMQYQNAYSVIRDHRPPHIQSKLVEQEYLSALIFQKDANAFNAAISRFNHLDSSMLLRARIEFSLLNRDWHAANEIISSAEVSGFEWSEGYRNKVDEVLAFRPKRPWLAGFYSAMIPGMGKIYSKNAKEGITSFLFVSALAYQSYRGFHKRGAKSLTGWIYGGLSLGFYLGNIYGAQQSAKNYNARYLNSIYHEMDTIIYSRH